MCYGCNFCNRCGKFDDRLKENAQRRCPRCRTVLKDEDSACPGCGLEIPPLPRKAGEGFSKAPAEAGEDERKDKTDDQS